MNIFAQPKLCREAVPTSITRSRSQLNQDGAARFGDWTGKNINNYLAVVLDDKVQSIVYIKSQIFDMGEISGSFSKASAEEIALSLSSGYIDAIFKIIEERPFK